MILTQQFLTAVYNRDLDSLKSSITMKIKATECGAVQYYREGGKK